MGWRLLSRVSLMSPSYPDPVNAGLIVVGDSLQRDAIDCDRKRVVRQHLGEIDVVNGIRQGAGFTVVGADQRAFFFVGYIYGQFCAFRVVRQFPVPALQCDFLAH